MNNTYFSRSLNPFQTVTLLVFLFFGNIDLSFGQGSPTLGSSSGGSRNAQSQAEFRDSGLTADTAKIFFLHPDDLTFKRVKKLDQEGFQQFNPASQGDYNFMYLSNLGAPAMPLIYRPTIRRGFDLGYHQYDLYLKKENEARFYNAYRPYTDLFFSANTQENNWIKATFAQNISPQVNFSIDYRKFSERGFYQSQRVRHTNIGITTWFRTDGDRYLGFFSWNINNIKNQNNGGITADSLLQQAQFRNNVSLIPVNTSNSAQTEFDHTELSYTHFLNFGKKRQSAPKPDTIDFPGPPPPLDTLNGPPPGTFGPPSSGPPPEASGNSGPPETTNSNRVVYVERDMASIQPQTGLQHQILYSTQQYKFFDDSPAADSSFYGDFQTSQQGIRNFIRVRTLENTFSLPFSFRGSKSGDQSVSFLLKPFLRYSLHLVNQEPEEFQVNNLFVGGDLEIQTQNQAIDLNLHAETGLADNAGDILFQGAFQLDVPKIGRFEANLNSQIYRPNLIQQRLFISQIPIWETNFQKTNELNLEAAIAFPKWKNRIGVAYHLIDRMIYFDENIAPVQADEALSIFQISYQQKARFWKMGFESSMAFQVIDKDFLRLPDFWVRSGLYFTGKIFGTMETRLGGDLTFTSGYRGDTYFSGAGQFYLQNETSLTALPMFEVYFSAQVQNFRVMIKAVNLSDLMFQEALFAAPNYPYPGYHIRFAIGWRFID